MLSGPFGLSEYDSDHAVSAGFAVSAPLDFFLCLLRVKLVLAPKQDIALGLSCALNDLSQSTIFLQGSSFTFLHQFSLQITYNFLLESCW